MEIKPFDLGHVYGDFAIEDCGLYIKVTTTVFRYGSDDPATITGGKVGHDDLQTFLAAEIARLNQQD